MYHLFVSGNDDSWLGEPWLIRDRSRCLDEYTEPELRARYGTLGADAVNDLRRYPCIFAYEQGIRKDPRFGVIRDVIKRSAGVKIEYEIIDLDRFLTTAELADAAFDLDIQEWELNRTHWALKNVDLAKELHSKGIVLPSWARSSRVCVDISSHQFDVALSFPGEVRDFVRQVARELERILGPYRYFYDDNYISQLARPSLDTLLQDLYGKRSRLIAVFLCSKYQEKRWCGIEWRSIREIINRKSNDRVIYVRMDDGQVEGVFPSDGYIDGRLHTPADVARFIAERVELLPTPPPPE
jgi:hypothetical protein